MTIDDETRQSCHSFSVGFSTTLSQLDDKAFGVVLKAMVDDTPGLQTLVRKDLRDAAIRELAPLIAGSSTRAKSSTIARQLNAYLSGRWLRERDGGPVGGSPAQRLLYRVAWANGGQGLVDRQVARIIEGDRGA